MPVQFSKQRHPCALRMSSTKLDMATAGTGVDHVLLLDDGTPAGIEVLPRIPLVREADESTRSLVRLCRGRSCGEWLVLLCAPGDVVAPEC